MRPFQTHLAVGDVTTEEFGTAGACGLGAVADLSFATRSASAYGSGVSMLFLGPFRGAYTPEDLAGGTVGEAAELVTGPVGDLDGDGRDDALISSPRSSASGGIGYVALVPGSLVP